MSDDRPKRDTMSLEEATISNMWEIAAIVELLEQKGLCTKQTKMRVYFAHPHSPWERGTNENTNGLLRQFFHKGTRFTRFSRREIKRVQVMLNDRPRKILNWHSPAHAFHQLLH